MGINNVPSAGQALVGKVDAIFVPNDTTVYGAFESLVKVAQDGKVPLFTAERRSVQRGAVATVGFDFVDMGKRTADMVDKVLKGTKPGDMDVQYMKDLPNSLALYVNKDFGRENGRQAAAGSAQAGGARLLTTRPAPMLSDLTRESLRFHRRA